jgi:hypothetical protein
VAQEGLVLTETPIVAVEKATADKDAHGEFESECPGYCGAQDTFYVGTLKGVGRISQQTFIDTYSKVGFAKRYDRKTPVTAADLLNDQVLPFFEQHDVPLNRVLTDRGTEYCGAPERHEYELYLAVENIDHTRTKTRHPPDPRHLRTVPQDHAERVLSRGIPEENLSDTGGTAARPGGLATGVQRAAAPSRTLVLWQNAESDMHRQSGAGEGENPRSVKPGEGSLSVR